MTTCDMPPAVAIGPNWLGGWIKSWEKTDGFQLIEALFTVRARDRMAMLDGGVWVAGHPGQNRGASTSHALVRELSLT